MAMPQRDDTIEAIKRASNLLCSSKERHDMIYLLAVIQQISEIVSSKVVCTR